MKHENPTSDPQQQTNSAMYLEIQNLPQSVKAALAGWSTVRTVDPKTLERHPESALYPDLPVSARWALADDIGKNGQREPILLFKKKAVVDGWQRCQACIELGRPVLCIDLPEEAEPFLPQLARSCNVVRRQMDKGQLAVLAAKAAPALVEKGIGTRSKNLKQNSAEPTHDPGDDTSSNTAEQMAKIYTTSPSYYQSARRLLKDHPEIADQVLAGEFTLSKGVSMAKKTPSGADPAPESVSPAELLQVVQGDPLSQLDACPAETVAMIVADCPLDNPVLVQALGRSAAKALKPGGRLLCVSDWEAGNGIWNLLKDERLQHLCYGFVGITPGPKDRLALTPARRFHFIWKPKPGLQVPVLPDATAKALACFGNKPMVLGGSEREVWRRLLELFGDPADAVLIPFAGRGLAARACLNLGRRCVAVEAAGPAATRVLQLIEATPAKPPADK